MERASRASGYVRWARVTLGIDMGISLTGLVNFVFTIQLRPPCAGESDAINTWIITKPVNPTTFSTSDGNLMLHQKFRDIPLLRNRLRLEHFWINLVNSSTHVYIFRALHSQSRETLEQRPLSCPWQHYGASPCPAGRPLSWSQKNDTAGIVH